LQAHGISQWERVAVAKFMEGYAVFTEERSKMGEKGRPTFPMHSICVPEHAAVVVSFLVNSNQEDVHRFANVMRDIALLKEGREIENAPSAHNGLMNMATKSNTVAPVDEAETADVKDKVDGLPQTGYTPGPAIAAVGGEIQEEITADSNGVHPEAALMNSKTNGHQHAD